MSTIVVRAPATSANLGSGFDCLGLALDLWNEVEAVPGESAPPGNLIVDAARAVFDLAGAPFPGFDIRSSNGIPFGRGLGSSASAIACGVLAANHCLGNPLDQQALLALAVRLEGHPDNVVPCFLGGAQVTTRDDAGRVLHVRIPLALVLHAVLFVPEASVATLHARGVLPASVPMADAVFNVARASLLVAALATGERGLLAEAARDRLHQPYRLSLFPAGGALLEAALDAGALAACTSGAGPSILALVDTAASGDAVQRAFERAAADASVAGATLRLGLTDRGAHVAH